MIDYSVYPDVAELPIKFHSLEEQADYVTRICGAWDFGMPPTSETFSLFATWKQVFDCFPLKHSPAYAAFRTAFGWTLMPDSSVLQANYERQGQSFDPCSAFTSFPTPPRTMQPIQPQRPANPDPSASQILDQLRVSNDSDIGGMTATNPALEKAIVERCLKTTATNLRFCKASVSDHSCRDNYDRLGWQG